MHLNFDYIKYFRFDLSGGLVGGSVNLSVFGHGKYAGMILTIVSGSYRSCSIDPDPFVELSRSVFKLKKILIKKYGLDDYEKLMKDIRISNWMF